MAEVCEAQAVPGLALSEVDVEKVSIEVTDGAIRLFT